MSHGNMGLHCDNTAYLEVLSRVFKSEGGAEESSVSCALLPHFPPPNGLNTCSEILEPSCGLLLVEKSVGLMPE